MFSDDGIYCCWEWQQGGTIMYKIRMDLEFVLGGNCLAVAAFENQSSIIFRFHLCVFQRKKETFFKAIEKENDGTIFKGGGHSSIIIVNKI